MYGVIEVKLINGTGGRFAQRPRPWCARIIGTDPTFGLKREFVKAVYDYTVASRKGKNIYVYFNLAPGIYEVFYPTSWKHEARYFVRVDNDGEVHTIKRAEVLECLNEC